MALTVPESVTRFRQFLQINTVHPTPEYRKCAEFLIVKGNDIEGRFIDILKLEGTDPSEKPILLSCHTDVVPKQKRNTFDWENWEYWTHPPFATDRFLTEDGDFRVYARDSQNIKVTRSMYLEAIRKIKSSNLKLKRTIFIVFAPYEEIGGKDGVIKFVETEEFGNMNFGADVDEGIIRSLDKTMFFYSERTIK
ncbi:Aminoacylase-1 [Smittium culicis]|uniref:Aminoacylase-1 n=1 Tax=Smittium culicis TaxID=133412 RepID=A0A1R1YQY8_9FUNG|nr:Aminoacylase-1 [Smittium culicis]